MKTFDAKFDFRDKRNLSLVMDFYELTMSQCYFNRDKNEEVVFDMFYRSNPNGGGYCICAGLEEVIGYIQNLHFEEEDIAYLRSLNKFSEEFLDYLRHFIFTGDIYAIPEGTPVFPYHRCTASGDRAAAGDEPPDAHRHQGQTHRPGSERTDGHGIRCPPRP